MRDYLIFAIVFASLPFALKRPVIGLLAFVWISLMNPHRLTYGSAYGFPFAAVIAAITLVGLLITSEPKRLPTTPVTVTLVLFIAWMTLTCLTAFNPSLAWLGWSNVVKTVVMALIAMLVIHQEKDIKTLALVMALSLGFYGLKGGIFTLTSGGGSRVVGPAGTYISDNNTLALGLIAALPLIWYFQGIATKKWVRFGFIGLTLLTLIAIIGSYSRGALLGGAAMLFFLWLKSRQKLMSSVAIILIALITLTFMPDQWFERMNTINDYQEDASAMGRINGWQFAINVAMANSMGGGFNSFTPEMFYIYAPVPTDFHVAHSIYFQVLGDHGFVGLGLFLLLIFLAWRTGSRVKKFCKEKPEFKWAADLAMMCQVSLVGYAVAGAFLSMPYYDFFYYVVALLVLLEKFIKSGLGTNGDRKGITASSPLEKRRVRSDFV
jgi:putative inorganic carbon (hco3(-)) transporter